MDKISTGEPNTLGTYLKIAKTLRGKNSEIVKVLKQKIVESTEGENEKVLATETQMIYLIVNAP